MGSISELGRSSGRQWQSISVFLSGKSQGQRNLVGCSKEQDTTEHAPRQTDALSSSSKELIEIVRFVQDLQHFTCWYGLNHDCLLENHAFFPPLKNKSVWTLFYVALAHCECLNLSSCLNTLHANLGMNFMYVALAHCECLNLSSCLNTLHANLGMNFM